tara:strand:- start:114 stop:503 length:390 start_codon:yes stop_codon:yes gene_type:complete
MAGYSPKLPLRQSTEDGFCQLTKSIKEVATQNLKMLVLTSPGERMMDPNFGVGLYNFLFEQEDPAVHGRIAARIKEQAGKYLPFIEIMDVEFESTSVGSINVDPNYLGVRIRYRVIPLNVTDNLNINVR